MSNANQIFHSSATAFGFKDGKIEQTRSPYTANLGQYQAPNSSQVGQFGAVLRDILHQKSLQHFSQVKTPNVLNAQPNSFHIPLFAEPNQTNAPFRYGVKSQLINNLNVSFNLESDRPDQQSNILVYSNRDMADQMQQVSYQQAEQRNHHSSKQINEKQEDSHSTFLESNRSLDEYKRSQEVERDKRQLQEENFTKSEADSQIDSLSLSKKQSNLESIDQPDKADGNSNKSKDQAKQQKLNELLITLDHIQTQLKTYLAKFEAHSKINQSKANQTDALAFRQTLEKLQAVLQDLQKPQTRQSTDLASHLDKSISDKLSTLLKELQQTLLDSPASASKSHALLKSLDEALATLTKNMPDNTKKSLSEGLSPDLALRLAKQNGSFQGKGSLENVQRSANGAANDIFSHNGAKNAEIGHSSPKNQESIKSGQLSANQNDSYLRNSVILSSAKQNPEQSSRGRRQQNYQDQASLGKRLAKTTKNENMKTQSDAIGTTTAKERINLSTGNLTTTNEANFLKTDQLMGRMFDPLSNDSNAFNRQLGSQGRSQGQPLTQFQVRQAMDQIIQKAKLSFNNEQYNFSARLKPHWLGKLSFQVQYDRGSLIGKFSVENEQVKEMLSQHLQLLRREFSAQGLQVEQFEVRVQQDYISGQRQHDRNLDHDYGHNANDPRDRNDTNDFNDEKISVNESRINVEEGIMATESLTARMQPKQRLDIRV